MNKTALKLAKLISEFVNGDGSWEEKKDDLLMACLLLKDEESLRELISWFEGDEDEDE